MNLPEKNEDYRDVQYWDERYTTEEEYEWCKEYNQFKSLFNSAAPNKNDRILVIGCGNSNLSMDLYNDGYKFITNVDYSPVVVEKMVKKHGSVMDFIVMDMRDLTFPAAHFDIVIEKSTLDVLFTSDKSVWATSDQTAEDVERSLSSIVRVLDPSRGRFISVSFAEPYFRKQFYSKFWSSIQVETFGESFHYYFYNCTVPFKSN